MTVEIPLGSQKYPGLVALVDDEDYELVAGYSWHPYRGGTGRSKTFYALADSRLDRDGNEVRGDGVHGVRISMHGMIAGAAPGQEVDHADRNGLNNTRANLRIPTRSQQTANQGMRSDNTSGYIGVGWDKARNKWQAQIKVNGKTKRRRFDDEIEAVRWRDQLALEAFGEFAVLNLPVTERQGA